MKRIMIDAAKCDGCKSCCHRMHAGTQKGFRRQCIYSGLDTTLPMNPATISTKIQTEAIRPVFCRHCDDAGVRDVLHERRAYQGRADRACAV